MLLARRMREKNLVLPMEETNLGTFHKIWGARIKRAQAKLNLTGAQPPKRGGAMAPVAPPPLLPPWMIQCGRNNV